MQNVVLSNLAGQLARQGDVTAAFRLAASLESHEQRLTAIQLTACVIRDRESAK
jgi:hypothetical protein